VLIERDPTERFWAKVDKNGPFSPKDSTLCWLWMAGTTPAGYGVFYPNDGKHGVYAHRYAYELLVEAILAHPDRKIDHRSTCSKTCVNPDHLRLTTDKQNGENRRGPNSNSRSGVRGVYWDKRRKRWIVQVKHNREIYRGGAFPLDQFSEAGVAVIALRNRLFTHNDLEREAP
jgi:hypothetical protein